MLTWKKRKMIIVSIFDYETTRHEMGQHSRAMRSLFQNQLICYSCSSCHRRDEKCAKLVGLCCHSGWMAEPSEKCCSGWIFSRTHGQVCSMASARERAQASPMRTEKRMLIASTLTFLCAFNPYFSCFHSETPSMPWPMQSPVIRRSACKTITPTPTPPPNIIFPMFVSLNAIFLLNNFSPSAIVWSVGSLLVSFCMLLHEITWAVLEAVVQTAFSIDFWLTTSATLIFSICITFCVWFLFMHKLFCCFVLFLFYLVLLWFFFLLL